MLYLIAKKHKYSKSFVSRGTEYERQFDFLIEKLILKGYKIFSIIKVTDDEEVITITNWVEGE